MSGGGFAATAESARVSIPSGIRRTIEDIKEITCNDSDEEVYAMLRLCFMDPNETVERLLLQDTFHLVEGRKKKKKRQNRSSSRKGSGGSGGSGSLAATAPLSSAAGRRAPARNTTTRGSFSSPFLTRGKQMRANQGTSKQSKATVVARESGGSKPSFSEQSRQLRGHQLRR